MKVDRRPALPRSLPPFLKRDHSAINCPRHRFLRCYVYSSYEKTRLAELVRDFPNLARPIAGIVKRLSDLLPVVRDGLYHPGFEFGNSIKSVAPALCPDVTYDDLGEIGGRHIRLGGFLADGKRES